MSFIRFFGGSCGLTSWRRCQPSNGATRSEPGFPTKREGPARRRRRHAMVVEALVPPDAARVAIRIATRDATVYTNAPKRHREAIFTDLCTLLRRRPGGDAHIAGAVTQPPTHTNSRSFIHKVHRCWMSAYLPLSAGCYGSDSPLLSSSSYRRTRRSACGF